MASVGVVSLYLAFISICYAIVAAIMGLRSKKKGYIQSSRGATFFSALMVSVSVYVLIQALIKSDFRFAYVADYTSRDLPLVFKVAAMWAGQAGSLLLWLFLLSVITLVVQLNEDYRRNLVDLSTVSVINLLRLFFVFLLLSVSSPFKTLSPVPYYGAGLNPMLQSLGMVIHPPVLFLGFSGFIVPFALVVVDLWAHRKESLWGRSRPWVLFSWVMLTAGIVTGGNWAYTELGWGGYWAWDPVENASLFPWLTSTALLHTLILQRHKKGMKVWNFILISMTFVLVLFGTFLTRSDILDSVHAFADNRLGHYFLAAIIGVILFTAYLLMSRYGQLKSPGWENKFFSKETSFVFTTIFLLLILAGVFLGTVFPLISQSFWGRKVVPNRGFYDQMTVPFWLGLVFLMGLCPVLSWKKAEGTKLKRMLIMPALVACIAMVVLAFSHYRHWLSTLSFGISAFTLTSIFQEFALGVWSYKKRKEKRLLASVVGCFRERRRKYGAYIVHAGIVIILIGIAGSSFAEERIQILDPGGEIKLGNYRLQYEGLKKEAYFGNSRVTAVLQVYNGEKYWGKVSSEKVFYPDCKQPATNVGILSNLKGDIYFNLAGWNGERAQLQVSFHPLVAWIWIGSYIIYLGVLVILWPQQKNGDSTHRLSTDLRRSL